MKYLIDSHILLWYISGDQRVSSEIKTIIRNRANPAFISKKYFG
ncbi:MAG: hypothetical protein AB7S72_10250 [Draconibacterium sp.]